MSGDATVNNVHLQAVNNFAFQAAAAFVNIDGVI